MTINVGQTFTHAKKSSYFDTKSDKLKLFFNQDKGHTAIRLLITLLNQPNTQLMKEPTTIAFKWSQREQYKIMVILNW